MNKTTILLIVRIAVLAFAVGTATSVSNLIIPAVQAEKKSSSGGSSGNSGSGSVPLTSIKTGDTALDKTIQSFYNCIKKTGHTGGSKPEPSKSEVIDCYSKEFRGNV
jgi:hypothetical protein